MHQKNHSFQSIAQIFKNCAFSDTSTNFAHVYTRIQVKKIRPRDNAIFKFNVAANTCQYHVAIGTIELLAPKNMHLHVDTRIKSMASLCQ